MKLVLDTNTVVSGFLWRNAPRLIIDEAVEGRITLATSTVLVDELAEVISRTKFARKLAEQGLYRSVHCSIATRSLPLASRRHASGAWC